MLRHRGTCDGDRAFQSLKNGTGIPYAFFVSGRLTAARQETLATFFFILFGCAAVINFATMSEQIAYYYCSHPLKSPTKSFLTELIKMTKAFVVYYSVKPLTNKLTRKNYKT